MNVARGDSKSWPLRDFVNLRLGEMHTVPGKKARAQGKIAERSEKAKRWVRMASPPSAPRFPRSALFW
jgi:hypothetical protein